MKGRVLIIAGSDPSGGAGVQADIKSVTALGGYAASAITSLTVQNTRGVTAVHATPPALIRAQITAVLDDIGADAIKIGMIGERAAGLAIADTLVERAAGIPIILDPVLVATSGDMLASDGVVEVLLARLTPIAALVTPNVDEALALTGVRAVDAAGLAQAGEALLRRGATAALVKGGHLDSAIVENVLVSQSGTQVFSTARIKTTSTHGTGCTLASACATGVAQGMPLSEAVGRAINYVHEAIRTAPGFGSGAGPVNHAWPFRPA